MIISPIKTKPITVGADLFELLAVHLPTLSEGSVVVVTSKIVSVCQKRVVKIGDADKGKLVISEADYYIPKKYNRYDVLLTIKNNILIAWAGVDESNGNGYYILWPKDIQKITDDIWKYIKEKNKIKNLGVIITDSRLSPLRWGTTGVGLSYCGFKPLNDYRGKNDIYNRKLVYTQSSVLDGLAAAAVVAMGEGDEQTPIAVIDTVPFVQFIPTPPSKDELKTMHIEMDDDLYAPLLKTPIWTKGGKE